MEIGITVEVHCQQPLWAINHREDRYRDSKYRLYIDNDLITERSWLWNNSTFLQENLWANLHPAAEHTLTIEPVTYIPEQAKFSLAAFKIEGQLTKIVISTRTKITFKLV